MQMTMPSQQVWGTGGPEVPEVKGLLEFRTESIRKSFIRKVYSILLESASQAYCAGRNECYASRCVRFGYCIMRLSCETEIYLYVSFIFISFGNRLSHPIFRAPPILAVWYYLEIIITLFEARLRQPILSRIISFHINYCAARHGSYEWLNQISFSLW